MGNQGVPQCASCKSLEVKRVREKSPNNAAWITVINSEDDWIRIPVEVI